MAPQHRDLTEERWIRLGLDRQILSIAAEMVRARGRLRLSDLHEARRGYERVLNLADLTVQVNARRGFRRELLRWRELAGALYVAASPSLEEHDQLLRALLLFSPAAFQQLPYLLPDEVG